MGVWDSLENVLILKILAAVVPVRKFRNAGNRRGNTDPPRILEPGKWGSKVRGLAHVQGYRGPQGYAFWNLQVPVPNLSTASRLGWCQVPNLATSSRFFKHFIFRFAVGRKIV